MLKCPYYPDIHIKPALREKKNLADTWRLMTEAKAYSSYGKRTSLDFLNNTTSHKSY